MRKRLFDYSKNILITTLLPLAFACNHETKNNNESGNAGKDSYAENERERERDKMEMKADTSKPKENPYKNAQLDIKIFKNDTVKDSHVQGFGYDIYMYRSLYVHQPHIPAINGNRGFDTEDQAHKVAEFIVYKIKNNIMPPSVTPQELDSLGVLK
ncbi:MAG: DUF4907 domain-containing protein [Bacteroidota bacterium]